MKKSVRLRHPQLRAPLGGRLNYVVELAWQKNASTDACNRCSRPNDPVVHGYKTLHLDLDEEGYTYVHPGILNLLRRVPTMAGLEIVNELDNAPPLVIGAVEQPKLLTVNSTEAGPGHDLYVPGRTQQEAEKRVQAPIIELLEPLVEAYDRKVTAERAEKRSIFVMGRRREQ